MALTTSSDVGAPLISLAVYCPLLCADKEEHGADNILFYFPSDTHLNLQMNQVGFCIAISSLAPRFGVHCSWHQTIRKQRSSVCLMSPAEDLWVSAHVRGGNEAALTTHHLLQLSCALFELLYSADTLLQLTLPNIEEGRKEGPPTGSGSSTLSTPTADKALSSDTAARPALRSFFTRCATFISSVLAAQCKARDGATEQMGRPGAAMSAQDWAHYLSAEASFGLPLRFVSDRELPSLQLGRVEEVVRHILWRPVSGCTAGPDCDAPSSLGRDSVHCCVFHLPSLHVVMADSRLPRVVVQSLKYYLVLYAPIACTSFRCHVPPGGPCEAAVWLDGNVVVVLVDRHEDQASSVGGRAVSPSLMEHARIISSKIRQLLSKPAAGATSVEANDAYWLSTRDVPTHQLYYKLTLKPPIAASSGLVAHWRLRGTVVEGTPFRQVVPGLVEYVRALVYSTKLCLPPSTSPSVLEYWTRWNSFWVYLRFAGPTVTALAWQHQQLPMRVRELAYETQRLLLVAP
ncbi:conserved hypothetical protein [Leishmania mexicana MHOM/GT/2001/U1103]|uniref:CCZ1/INTU/HSP4 first Longin domain-containing protein n=1 Tax=Leishmania mexicana (strain MHOM/GT/2001/U1103) TaxID=929439 RepID=E9ATA4_LEIMU|nr:conserved hypothetical protein [Leishmania mexicana MHOM/GT/2001/U1103]CBZ26178.1 conserved hypothetical protein [Leishmania mexicana MHOM/GT/2001/U1103]